MPSIRRRTRLRSTLTLDTLPMQDYLALVIGWLPDQPARPNSILPELATEDPNTFHRLRDEALLDGNRTNSKGK